MGGWVGGWVSYLLEGPSGSFSSFLQRTHKERKSLGKFVYLGGWESRWVGGWVGGLFTHDVGRWVGRGVGERIVYMDWVGGWVGGLPCRCRRGRPSFVADGEPEYRDQGSLVGRDPAAQHAERWSPIGGWME